MYEKWLLYIAGFSMAFAVSVLATPLAKKLAYKFHAVDYPRARGMNKEPVPRLGGVAIVMGYLAALFVLVFFEPELRTKQFAGFTVGAVIIVITGMLDDVYQLSAKLKLLIQILVAVIVVVTGTQLDFIMWPIWRYLKPFSPFITVFWIVGLINAVNLIDGLDGLAAGVTAIASTTLAVLCTISGSTLAAILTITLSGAALGFLPRNFAPAEIYMGDTGSMFLGYMLAVCSCIGVFKSYAILSVILSVLAMALPILDTSFAMIRRAVNHRPIMSPDRGHMHHRLVDMGYSSKQAVIILYLLSIGSSLIAVIIALQDIRATVAVLIFFLILIIILLIYRKRV